ANESGQPCADLTACYIHAMHEDERALQVLAPDVEPRATGSMTEILALIQALLDRGYAYIGPNGDVFYSVSKFENYGLLSGKNPDELRAGERVDVDLAKQDPLDFVLWKMAKPGEPCWDSPWGVGRPGWHIECSAMSTHCLGNHFDIHGGGMDLQFPHHENEIAQSEAATGRPFVNFWMHNGFVRINEEKMSKSLGNFFTVRQVLERYRGEVIRLFILSSHYRSPLNYSDDQLDEAEAALTRLYTALRDLNRAQAEAGGTYAIQFQSAMDDDFNTPIALSILFEIAREINRSKLEDRGKADRLGARLRSLGGILGILQEDPEQFLKAAKSTGGGFSDREIDRLIEQRLDARKKKDWQLADRIRDDLKAQGVILEDVTGTTHWRRG
ncbi:MAG: cysteine--tRNA ligase, partial [Methylococcales bacterium]